MRLGGFAGNYSHYPFCCRSVGGGWSVVGTGLQLCLKEIIMTDKTQKRPDQTTLDLAVLGRLFRDKHTALFSGAYGLRGCARDITNNAGDVTLLVT